MTHNYSLVKAHYKSKLPIHKSKSLNLRFVDAEDLYNLMTIHVTFGSWLRNTLEAYGAKRKIDYLVIKCGNSKKVILETEFAAELAKSSHCPRLALYLNPPKKGG